MFFATLLWSTFLYSALVHPLGTFIAIQMTGAVVKRISRDSENMSFEKSAEIRHPSITRLLLQSCAKKVQKISFLDLKWQFSGGLGMREGGLPLPLAFQYLIIMILRACDLNLVMISLLASKWQNFKLRGLQFHYIKWLKKGHFNFKVLAS